MTPRAAMPGARRCGGYHGFPPALLKPLREQPRVSAAPSSQDRLPAAEISAPRPTPGPQLTGPNSAPQLRPEPPPGFQNHLAVDRQAAQPIRSRKASAQRSPGGAGQSTSPDPFIPPSEDKFCLAPAAMLSVAAALLRLEGRFSYPFTPCFALSALGAVHARRYLTPGAVEGGGAAPRGW